MAVTFPSERPAAAGELNQPHAAAGQTRSFMITVAGLWTLLFGVGAVMLGHGLQTTLLAVRANAEGFSDFVIGLIMSGYFVGYSAGTIAAPRWVRRAGHVRAFAAFSSIVSALALLHILFVTPSVWLVFRAATGFCLSGLYVVAESWLNEQIDNQYRGRLLSVYMVIMLGGAALGPLLLNVSDPGGYGLFVLVSILFSIALVPLLLNIGPVPASDADEKIGFRELLTVSPLGVFGCALTGFSNGAVLGMGAVYAKSRGFDVAMISVFISTVVVGGVLFQWPVGLLSDRWDRRWVLAVITFGATVCAVSTVFIGPGAVVPIFAAALLFGGMTFPMYSLSISLSNDQIPFEKMVAASATLVLATGLGAVAGPTSVGYAMARLGPWAFFGVLAVVHGLYGVYILYRIRYYSAVPEDMRGEHAYLTRTSPVMAAAAFEHFADPENDSVDENEPEAEEGFF